MGIFRTFVVAATLTLSTASQALLMTASPLEGQAAAEELYVPMAKVLSDALGFEVNFEYSRDWQNFSKQVLANSYDLILADPHIIAFATKSSNGGLFMDVMTRLPGQIKLNVVVQSSSDKSSLKSLERSRICMLPSPNYSGVMIKKEFTNPVIQPAVREVKGSYNEVFEKFKKGGCDAAVIDDKSFQRLTAAGEDIKSIYQSKASPNLGLAISQRITPTDRALIVQALQDPATKEKLANIFNKYSSGSGPFEDATNEDYQPFNILPGVVWGW